MVPVGGGISTANIGERERPHMTRVYIGKGNESIKQKKNKRPRQKIRPSRTFVVQSTTFDINARSPIINIVGCDCYIEVRLIPSVSLSIHERLSRTEGNLVKRSELIIYTKYKSRVIRRRSVKMRQVVYLSWETKQIEKERDNLSMEISNICHMQIST